MHYRLRTLMVLLAVLPPVLAFWWWMRGIGFGVIGALGLILPTLSLVVVAKFCLETLERRWRG